MNAKADAARRKILAPLAFKSYILAKLPLAAAAGLQLRSLDDTGCTVALPGGWRTQNPFRSTYFAAQAMAAEMSTGAPAMVLVSGANGSVAMLVREVRSTFLKKIQGESLFTFSDVAAMQAVIDRAAAGGDGETFTARAIGRNAKGEVASEFDITWSFRRRG